MECVTTFCGDVDDFMIHIKTREIFSEPMTTHTLSGDAEECY